MNCLYLPFIGFNFFLPGYDGEIPYLTFGCDPNLNILIKFWDSSFIVLYLFVGIEPAFGNISWVLTLDINNGNTVHIKNNIRSYSILSLIIDLSCDDKFVIINIFKVKKLDILNNLLFLKLHRDSELIEVQNPFSSFSPC